MPNTVRLKISCKTAGEAGKFPIYRKLIENKFQFVCARIHQLKFSICSDSDENWFVIIFGGAGNEYEVKFSKKFGVR